MSMNALIRIATTFVVLALPVLAQQQNEGTAPATEKPPEKPTFAAASADFAAMLQQSLADLAKQREQFSAEKLPMAQQLRELEGRLQSVRLDYQKVSRLLDSRTLDLGNLRTDIDRQRDEARYLQNLLSEYNRNFEARLHIAELQRYKAPLETAKLALDNSKLSEDELFAAEIPVVQASLGRVNDVLGGARFEGKAVDPEGVIRPGTFVVIGPTAVFRSADGQHIGTAEQRLGTLEPTVTAFVDPAEREAAAQVAMGTGGAFPFDSTLGNAHKVAAIEETWWQHFKKGGPLMWPIGILAIAAFVVVLAKWLHLLFVRRPAKKQVDRLLGAARAGDRAAAMEQAETLAGPAGAMLRTGAEHIGEPRELIEEVMYEHVLSTRLRLNSWLPFVAICASSAPLLGLLGTVTGIMNTFNLMTVFGTGDPKTLSSGISEALITTEYGLLVAIPSLLLHAFLSRKARSVVDEMEKQALRFLAEVHRSEVSREAPIAVGVA
jgi:biopolymer transport protein ExbB